MNWTIIIIETIVLTAAFTAMILIPLMKAIYPSMVICTIGLQ